MGDAPSSRHCAGPGPGPAAPGGSSRAAASGGTASTTPSASMASRADVPRSASSTRNRPAGNGVIPATFALSRISAPSSASFRAPAWPCRSPSGMPGVPMSAASRRPSSAVLITVAASARLASSPATLSADTVNRSQSTRRARSPWPRAASQSPSRWPSSAGSAGSRNRMGSAARLTCSRSRQRQQPVPGQRLAEVQRAGQRGAAQPGLAGRAEHGDVEPVLQRHRAGHAEPGDQLPVGGAAAEEDVLPVVHDQRRPG